MHAKAMTWGLAAAVVTGLAMGTGPAAAAELSATPATVNGASFTTTLPVPGAPLGVSPEVFYDDITRTYYLWPTSMPAREYRSSDGQSWAEVAGATLPRGIDWSVVKEGPSSYRMYYAEISPNLPAQVRCTNMRKQLRYATSSDLVNWTTQPGILMDDIGCGVPHVLKKRDGSYLLYWNTITSEHGVHVARSSDGLSWTNVTGPLNNDRTLVDPSPIEMPDGTFLMVAASGGGPSEAQELRIGSSTDGITWTFRSKPLFAPSGYHVFDPALELVDGQLRVWYSYAPLTDMQRAEARVASGTVTLGSPTTTAAAPKAAKGKACTKKGAKSGVLVCTASKGKLVWARR